MTFKNGFSKLAAEREVNRKFPVKLKETVTENFNMLREMNEWTRGQKY
jgi:hypothetical protein